MKETWKSRIPPLQISELIHVSQVSPFCSAVLHTAMKSILLCMGILFSCLLAASALPTIAEARDKFDNRSNFGLMFVRSYPLFTSQFRLLGDNRLIFYSSRP